MAKAKTTRSSSLTAASKRPASSAKAGDGNAHANNNLEDTIRTRAYELYEARGRENGLDQDDWFRAEAEVTARGSKQTA